MTLIRDHPPRSMLAPIMDWWRMRKARRDERRALDIIAAKPHAHLLEDAGLTHEDATHMAERERLHTIADWTRWRGRGI